MNKTFALLFASALLVLTSLVAAPAQATTPIAPATGGTSSATSPSPQPSEKLTASINGVEFVPPSAGSSGGKDATTMATWAACGNFDGQEKLVRQFWRSGWAGVVTSGWGYLRCGPTTSTWGYRHIRDSHQQDWYNIAFGLGSDWRSFADWCIEQVLANPDYVVYRDANATFTYRTIVYIHNSQGEVISTYRPIVSIGLGNERIITAYPAH